MTYNLTIDDFIGPGAYTSAFVREVVEPLTGVPIDVKIASLGGSLSDSLDMRRIFSDHGEVTAHICGMTASGATIAAMGAKRILMDEGAFFLVHKCLSNLAVFGPHNADDLDALITSLEANKLEQDKLDLAVAAIYARRTGRKVEDMLALMREGTWLNAQEAKELGFVDEIEKIDEPADLTAHAIDKLDAFGLPQSGLPYQPEEAASEGDAVHGSVVKKLLAALGCKQKTKEAPAPTPTVLSQLPDNLKPILGKETVPMTPDNMAQLCPDDVAAVSKAVDDMVERLNAAKQRCAELEQQVKNLRCAPAEETMNIENDASEVNARPSSSQLFESIKKCL